MGTEECKLIGGWFANLVQCCLAFICLSILVFKRHVEFPQRPWKIWFFDVSKQALGSSFGHFYNIFFSGLFASTISGSDECQWYFLSYFMDVTVGTVINVSILFGLGKLARCSAEGAKVRRSNSFSIFDFGQYGNPPSTVRWFCQLIIWFLIVLCGKMAILLVFILFQHPLEYAISRIFYFFRPYPKLELVTVMVVIPLCMNGLQFWILDSFLKHPSPTKRRRGRPGDKDDFQQPFYSKLLIHSPVH